MNVSDFLRELRRRKVTRVAVVYAIVGWLVMQVGDIVLPALGLPVWSVQLVVVLVLLGFPVALVLGWAFEMTPDGIQRDSAAAADAADGLYAPHDPDAPRGPHAPHATTTPHPSPIAALGLGALVLAVAAFGWYSLRPAPQHAGASESATRFASAAVAVLPFDNFGNDREDYFSDGMTEDIIAQLTRIPDLTVVSRTSSMRYRNTELSLREIGRELAAGVILEGSVRRHDGRVRVVAQLVDVDTDTHLWAETYDREIEDIFAVQSEVAREIASALGRTLGPRTGGRAEGEAGDAGKAGGAGVAPTDQETYDLYLRGRHLWHQRRIEALYSAIEYFRQAIERDPGFALAHVALADAYITLTFADPGVESLELVALAEAAIEEALALDPNLGEAHAALALGSLVSWNWEAAARHFPRSLELTPGYVSAHHWNGVWKAILGRHDEAASHMRRALEIDPFSARLYRDMSLLRLWAGRPADAAEHSERGLELNPGFAEYHLTAFHSYERVGRDEDAFEALLRAHAFSDDSDLSTDELRSTFRQEGPKAAVRLALERAPDLFGFGLYRASFQIYIGDTEAALRSLEHAVDRHEGYIASITADPVMVDALGGDPRFQALVRRVGAPAS